MTRESDGLGILEGIPEYCRRVVVSFLSLESLGHLRLVSKAFRRIISLTPQWQWDAALQRLWKVIPTPNSCGCEADLADPAILDAIRSSSSGAYSMCHDDHAEIIASSSDPRFEVGFRALSAERKFRILYRYHRICLNNLHSFYDLEDFTSPVPGGGWSCNKGVIADVKYVALTPM